MPAPTWPARLLFPPFFPCSLSELEPCASGEPEQKMYSFFSSLLQSVGWSSLSELSGYRNMDLSLLAE
jgi:hypothetical protein